MNAKFGDMQFSDNRAKRTILQQFVVFFLLMAAHISSYFRRIQELDKRKETWRYKVEKIRGVILSDGTQTEIHLSRQTFFFCKNSPYSLFQKRTIELFVFSQLGADQQPVGPKHLHLQPQDFPSHRCSLQTGRSHKMFDSPNFILDLSPI